MSADHHSDSTPDSRCVPTLCLRLPCLLCSAGSTPDSNYNSRFTGMSVVSSHELVSGGNRQNSAAVVEWIPAAMLVQFAN